MRNIGNWSVYLQDEAFDNRLGVFLYQDSGDGPLRHLQPDGKIVESPRDYVVSANEVKPTFTLGRTQAQVLVNALAKKGILPEGRRFEQEMDLAKAHLEDMRRMVFSKWPAS